MTKPPRRRGPPRGNGNRITNALKASKLPKSAKYVESRLADFRHVARGELESLHGSGSVGLYLESLLLSATRHELRAQLCLRWLRVEEGLSLEQRLSLLAAIGTATDSRDRCLRSAGLDRLSMPADDDKWADLYPRGGKRTAVPESPAVEVASEPPPAVEPPQRVPQQPEQPKQPPAVNASPAPELPPIEDLDL